MRRLERSFSTIADKDLSLKKQPLRWGSLKKLQLVPSIPDPIRSGDGAHLTKSLDRKITGPSA